MAFATRRVSRIKRKRPTRKVKRIPYRPFRRFNRIPFNRSISQKKYHALDSSAGPTSFDLTVTPYTSYQLSSITQGDGYQQRATNNIRIRSVNFQANFNNFHTTDRFVRIMIVSLRGSSSTASTTTWGDIYADPSALGTKSGPNATTVATVLTINRDEYKVLHDSQIRVPGTNSGQSTTKKINIYRNINHLVQYVVDSTDTREGAIWLVLNPCEASGVAANANVLSMHYKLVVKFNDVRM